MSQKEIHYYPVTGETLQKPSGAKIPLVASERFSVD